MFSYISSLFNDPKETIIFFLLAFPGRILAISAHEFAHAWVADKCGDPTARNLGRLTLNPFAHLDLVGTLMMAFIGFGWAKPVPVNPRNFRNYRKDDLKVSIAGIALNLIFFLLGFVVLALFLCSALRRIGLPVGDDYYLYLLKNAPYVNEEIIAMGYGRLAGYLYRMLAYFVQVNIVLAVFNLLPVPPLDGSKVLFALLPDRWYMQLMRYERYGMILMAILLLTNVLDVPLMYLRTGLLNGLSALTEPIFYFFAERLI